MTTVAITGASGLVGTRLLAAVSALPDVERVLALDLRPPEAPGAPVTYRRLDVLEAAGVEHAFDGVDVVVHLAFQLDPIDDLSRMHAVNVHGTRTVFEAAAAAGVRKIVYASSATVYGAHADNDLPLTEDSPLRANPGFPYVEHKREVEEWLAAWLPDHRDGMVVTVLRPTIVVGEGIDNFISRAMAGPRMVAIRGHRPPTQLVHVDDVAAAFTHAVEHDLDGAYNVAAEGWLSFDELQAIMGRRLLDLPEEVAFSLAGRLNALGISELPVGAVNYLMHPWVVSVDRLVETGWRPRHSNRDACAVLAGELADVLVLGPVTASRRQVRQAATTSLAVAGGLLALGVLARRRRR